MNLRKLEEAIKTFKLHLQSPERFSELYKWESLKNWQARWDLARLDFGKMYDEAIENAETRRLWVGVDFFPKEMMLKFIAMQREFVREAFRDLFNENKDVVGRIGRFVFHCDQLLEEYRQLNPKTNDGKHFHHDYRIIALYLGFQFPEQYTLYEFTSFQKLLQRLGSQEIPTANDLERYFKIMRTLYKFLEKDAELMEAHQQRLDPEKYFEGKSLLLAHEFCIVTGQ